MPDKWLIKNGVDYQDQIVDTTLYNDFPEVRETPLHSLETDTSGKTSVLAWKTR